MKVTVSFGHVRVVVPCGDGDLPVTHLIEKAILRYKKAINKPSDYWVTVHSLKSVRDGGILDFDDRLNDVTDDREQIIAIYEEQDAPPLPHNGGDGTSASSAGSPSPDIFRGSLNNNNDKNYNPYLRQGNKNDVVITHNDLTHGSSLIVRRGSEPALNNVGKSGNSLKNNFNKSQDEKSSQSFASTKRWSAIAIADDTKTTRSLHGFSEEEDEDGENGVPFQRRSGSGEEMRSAFSKFARNSSRQSLASNNSAVFRWMEAQQQAEEEEEEREMQNKRKEPLGGSGNGDDDRSAPVSPHGLQGQVIVLGSMTGPLGIRVVPSFDGSGRDMGLVIESIEPGGRVYQDGRLHPTDRIIEINGTSLMNVDFDKAQDLFKQAIQNDRMQLRVIKTEAPPLPLHPPPLLARAGFFGGTKHGNLNISNNSVPSPIKLEDLTPARQVPPAPPTRHPSTTLSSPTKKDAPEMPPPKSTGKPKIVAPTNTRKIGKKINFFLTKGTEGLGFSVTTRDNTAGISAPIYIKNILSKGAAVADGTLKSGDRLLEVNSIEMTGKSQAEAVAILRNTKLGSKVNIVVSRQVVEEEDDKPAAPAELSKSTGPGLQAPESGGVSSEESFFATSLNRDVLTFDIPLRGSGAAGLGVSVKGKTSTTEKTTQDLGIFIKSVIAGGAASKDGRLFVNDQLLEVNNENLAEKSNADAMEALRLAMQKDGPKSGYITVVIGRRQGLAPLAVTPTKDLNKSSLEVKALTPLTVLDLPTNTPHKDTPNKSEFKTSIRTPSLDKILDSDTDGGIRNLSYMKATHESFMDPASPAKTDAKLFTPKTAGTTSSSQLEMSTKIVTEKSLREKQQKPKTRPASTIGFSRSAMAAVPSSGGVFDGEAAPKPPGWLVEWDKQRDSTSSEVCPDDEDMPFSREAFGRRSMSEKRRGHLDPRISEFYNKLKESRSQNFPSDKRSSSVNTGPSLGLKKSSSLESLQTAVQDATLDDESNQFRAAPNRGMIRGRGCNDSFRAAVDRSYDGPGNADAMETSRRVVSVQEESSENGSNTKVPLVDPMTASKRSSVSSEHDGGPKLDEARSEKKKTERKDKEKDKSLFKGLGHMYIWKA